MWRTEESCCRSPGLGAGAVKEGDVKMEQKGTMRDQGVGEAQSVTELAAEGGGDSRQRPAPGWYRNMQCDADGVRGSPGGCENTELRSVYTRQSYILTSFFEPAEQLMHMHTTQNHVFKIS